MISYLIEINVKIPPPPPKNFTMWELFGLPLFNHPNMATFSFVRDRVNPSQPVEGNKNKYIFVYQRILGKYQNPKFQEITFPNYWSILWKRLYLIKELYMSILQIHD